MILRKDAEDEADIIWKRDDGSLLFSRDFVNDEIISDVPLRMKLRTENNRKIEVEAIIKHGKKTKGRSKKRKIYILIPAHYNMEKKEIEGFDVKIWDIGLNESQSEFSKFRLDYVG